MPRPLACAIQTPPLRTRSPSHTLTRTSFEEPGDHLRATRCDIRGGRANPFRLSPRHVPSLGCLRTGSAPQGGSFRWLKASRLPTNRTGQQIDIPIVNGGVSAADWSKVLPGVWFYDPAFGATAECESSITLVDGDEGILRYRGYPIEQLAEHSSYLEVGLPPSQRRAAEPVAARRVDRGGHASHLHPRERAEALPRRLPLRRSPMGMLVSAVGALSTFYPEAKDIFDAENRHRQIVRLIAKMPTLAAAAHRFSVACRSSTRTTHSRSRRTSSR